MNPKTNLNSKFPDNVKLIFFNEFLVFQAENINVES